MVFTFASFRLAFIATLLLFEDVQLASSSRLAFHRRSTAASPHTSRAPSCVFGSSESSSVVANNSTILWPYQVYKSASFNPPKLDITTYGKALAPGLLFITPTDFTPLDATKDHAPLIMDSYGQLIWNGPITNATNLRVASYQGDHVLTYWSGISSAGANIGHGYGKITFLDASYNEILHVCPRFALTTPDNTTYPCDADLHESHLTERDTLLVTAYNVTTADLSSIGGPVQGWVYDCLFFELSPINGTVLFRWSSLEHIPIKQTKQPLRGTGTNQSVPFDYFHINSVIDVGDTFLVSARHTWTIYLVSALGSVLWTLQGDTGGDFGPLPINGRFSWQHHARPHKITNSSFTLSIFNNFNSFGIDNGTHPTNGLSLKLPLPPNRSTSPLVLQSLSDPTDPIYAGSQGSLSTLPNGNAFMGYGEIAVLKEFGPFPNTTANASNGDVHYSARFGADNLVQSYRGFKAEWVGWPLSKPSLVVEREDGCAVGYVSWNGATEVESWVVFAGLAADELERVGSVGWKGFETRFTVAGACVQIGAVIEGRGRERDGKRSEVVCV